MEEASTPSSTKPIPVFRMMDEQGQVLPGVGDIGVSDEKLIKMYKKMVTLNVMDKILYDAQRQGRISFYMTNYGEEGAAIASAAALDFTDTIYGQYREAGAILWRGFSLNQCMNQCYGNRLDKGAGKQMPVHYGDDTLNYQTISSCLSTQMPQAPGHAYAMKLQNKKSCVMCYFGDGAAQEGDAHAALNFAATLECPVIFFCRNNGFAISTPTKDQYAGDGIASRGVGYGVETYRIDGNDVLAVHKVTSHARRICVEEGRPVLIEAMTYRIGHHSTSDDSSKYRPAVEVKSWNTTNCPIRRLQGLLRDREVWNDESEQQLKDQAREDVLKAFGEAEKELRPSPNVLFTDVYDDMPPHLQKQKDEMWANVKAHPDNYPTDKFE
ncbi:2-oxoisovalerate dehydrogenase subunit alpha, mitochondrial-like isoform X2 [Dysidea avara]